MFKLNPTVLLVILIGIGFQNAFSQSITLNIIVAVVGLLYLLLQRVSGKVIVIMLLVAAPLAFGTWWSFIAFGTGDTHRIALVYASRLYAYLLLGAALTLTTHVKDLLISLHSHAKLSSTFTYGLLAAFNLLPRVRRQVQTIRYAASLRGITYHFWSPQLYFKAIVSALHWSDDLAMAMTSHGFTESFPRTQTATDSLPIWHWAVVIILIVGYAIVAWIIKPY
ncbi:energy-coupling factor transporter transmembrane component T family protein [Weissella confusa]|uniref:energy-coupling factor transporter transmembrane component T family protein n=1 Tax=Weissella confusa TaxID=1583 RepID=UPI0010806DB3|nr:energy-coupling factor transporter transmembrane component T [Weissella confusa]MBJ7627691.1 energy-coupling factor transporter transmembrane protein EcfT [Weissella confusa]TGE47817.1 ABC transporter permease [Weissella confusa]